MRPGTNTRRLCASTLLVWILVGFSSTAGAQFNIPLINQYYVNPYLFNPAQAGGYDYPVAYLTYKSQWTGVDGAPQVASFTANSPIFKQSGIGINVYNDQSGFLSRTKAVVSFSQTVFFSGENHYSSLGLSGGVIQQRINTSLVSGEKGKPIDPSVTNFNANNPLIPDADIGFAYRLYGLDANVVVPNLIKFTSYTGAINNSYAGLPLFMTSVGYFYDFSDAFAIHPMASFRKIQGISNQWDASMLFTFQRTVSIGAFYHNDHSMTASIGFLINRTIDINYAFTYSSAPVRQYFSNTHEFSIGYHFSKGYQSKSSVDRMVRCPHAVY